MPKVEMRSRREGKRVALIAKEKQQPLGWFYLSFASDTGFLGAAVVQAHGVLTATQRASDLGINPGGEVMCCPIPNKDLYRVPVDMRDRKLNEKEVRERLDGKRVAE